MLRLKQNFSDIISIEELKDGELAIITTYDKNPDRVGDLVLRHDYDLISISRISKFTWYEMKGTEEMLLKRLKTGDILEYVK